jgi:hypothetical protein
MRWRVLGIVDHDLVAVPSRQPWKQVHWFRAGVDNGGPTGLVQGRGLLYRSQAAMRQNRTTSGGQQRGRSRTCRLAAQRRAWVRSRFHNPGALLEHSERMPRITHGRRHTRFEISTRASAFGVRSREGGFTMGEIGARIHHLRLTGARADSPGSKWYRDGCGKGQRSRRTWSRIESG